MTTPQEDLETAYQAWERAYDHMVQAGAKTAAKVKELVACSRAEADAIEAEMIARNHYRAAQSALAQLVDERVPDVPAKRMRKP
jgi:hypothetical protein